MEKLETTLREATVEKTEVKSDGYEGLQLIEEKTYQGPTSIKYWM